MVTYQRQKLFHLPKTVESLRHAFRTVKATHPFTIEAIVVLPDHLRCIWTLPPDDADFSTWWQSLKTTFHYNPVLHKLVKHPKDWQYSSFHRSVTRGEYDGDWGTGEGVSFEANVGCE